MSETLLPQASVMTSKKRHGKTRRWITGISTTALVSLTYLLPSFYWPQHDLRIVELSIVNDTTWDVETSVSPELSPAQIQALVSSTDGFFARDYNLELGWNNMRYILEAALNQAKLLNRALIIPSFVYARGCEYANVVCSHYVPMVNRGDAVGSDEWRKLPIEEQQAWRIPMELMINMTHMRTSHPVITISEYLRLHGQKSSVEASNGHWTRDKYHVNPNLVTGKFPSLSVIPNSAYDPKEIIRVDSEPGGTASRFNFSVVNATVLGALYRTLPPGKQVLDWIQGQSALDLWSDLLLEAAVTQNGWSILHSYDMVAGLDYNKAVAYPKRYLAPRSALRGFTDDFAHKRTTVLLLEGATHYGRKQGAMYFTTRAAQDVFSTDVLFAFQRIDILRTLANKIVQHMYDLNEGRQWMAAHVRRGDFVRYHWTMESTPDAHIERVKKRLAQGRDVLVQLSSGEEELLTCDIPGDIAPDQSILTLEPPNPNDSFYVATDERDPHVLDLFRMKGAVMMDDLLTIEDRRQFRKTTNTSRGKEVEDDYAWALMITDVRALVEQVVLSEAAYFYGHAMSSVPGGVVNMRAARGADPRTSLVD